MYIYVRTRSACKALSSNFSTHVYCTCRARTYVYGSSQLMRKNRAALYPRACAACFRNSLADEEESFERQESPRLRLLGSPSARCICSRYKFVRYVYTLAPSVGKYNESMSMSESMLAPHFFAVATLFSPFS
jgi:hypothetical protein